MPAESPDDRKRSFVRRILESRRVGEPAVFAADDSSIEYADRTLRLEIASEGRDSLEDLLGEYHVFKIKQPETRKADDGEVYVSAVTDAKHAADFLEALFREVYGLDPDYELRCSRVR